MALTNSERQAKYREQIKIGERKRFQSEKYISD